MLLRVARRTVDGDCDSVHEFCDLHFPSLTGPGLDLRPSCYEALSVEAVQVVAEHLASTSGSPRTKDTLDLAGLQGCLTQTSPGATQFSFTKGRHREQVFETADELIEAMQELLNELSSRRARVPKKDQRTYSIARLSAGDPEWVEFCRERNSSFCK